MPNLLSPNNYGPALFGIHRRIWLTLILLLVVITSHFSLFLGLLFAVVGFVLSDYLNRYEQESEKRAKEFVFQVGQGIEETARAAIAKLPTGIAFVGKQEVISWHNAAFASIFKDHGQLLFARMDELLETPSWDEVKQAQDEGITVFLRDKTFMVKTYQSEDGTVVFFTDITDIRAVENNLRDIHPVAGLIKLDSFDQVLESTDADYRPELLLEIDKLLGDWAEDHGAYLQKYSEDRYLFFTTFAQLMEMKEDKFSVLDKLRELDISNKLPVTMSVGVAAGPDDIPELFRLAAMGVDLATGRGGDQAVVREGEDISFFGARTTTPKGRSRVRARVIARAIMNLVLQAPFCLIMGHEMPDLDSLGASLGLWRIVRDLGKEGFIILDEPNAAISGILGEVQNSKEYEGVFISSRQALDRLAAAPLVVVVDTHRPSLVAAPQVAERSDKVIIIDHHRRAEDILANPLLIYLEPYASSTSEMVSEILEYLDNQVALHPLEATALLSGIIVDTNSFAYQTGVGTFEAATFLRRAGADPVLIQNLLKERLEDQLARAEVVQNTELYRSSVAIGEYKRQAVSPRTFAAKAADDLLGLKGVRAAFVLCPAGQGVVISGRSDHDFNVQLVLEKLGGGGHFNIAGAQLKDITLDEAKQQLKKTIDAYLEEDAE